MADKDLAHPAALGELRWDMQNRNASLAALAQHAATEADQVIAWYLAAKRPKQRWARGIRATAILLVALAGIIPMLSQLSILQTSGMPRIDPVWASVVLAVAAALVGLDRYFGFSTAWIRFITTELQLRQALHEFRMDVESDKARWHTGPPNDEQMLQALSRCKAFIAQINEIVRGETALWVAEFQSSLKQLDESVKVTAAAQALGGVNLTVTNGDACVAGWQLSVDAGTPTTVTGKTSALARLAPGTHRISVAGTIAAAQKTAESLVNVPAGTIVALELTLA